MNDFARPNDYMPDFLGGIFYQKSYDLRYAAVRACDTSPFYLHQIFPKLSRNEFLKHFTHSVRSRSRLYHIRNYLSGNLRRYRHMSSIAKYTKKYSSETLISRGSQSG